MVERATFDVFLSHNSLDKPAVEALARRLEDEAHLHPFLDSWHLVPGEPWQEALEAALDHSNTCAVFIGSSGLGSWENEEMRSQLEARVDQKSYRIIPILLPGASMPDRGVLPRFLARRTWVDFRHGLDNVEAFHRLVAGIKGVTPGRLESLADAGISQPLEPIDIVTALMPLGLTCPYRGLEVFEEEHAPYFFGRSALTQHLIEALRGTRFLAVLGPSGSGKSSLVRAGLLPRLRQGALPSSDQWRYCIMKPGSRPLEELAVVLANPLGKDDLSGFQTALEADEREFHLQIRRALSDTSPDTRFCLVIDQFEELFTQCMDQMQWRRFVELLRYAATITTGQTVVVLTMRADFLVQAAAYPPLGDILSAHQFLVTPMVEEELRLAIEEPARLAGVECEDGLVEAILQDMGHEPGALPLMQHALSRLWEHVGQDRLMTLRAYRTIGGVQGALAQRADAIFEAFTVEEQRIARRILLRLTQPGIGTEDTRRRAARNEFLTHLEEQQHIDRVIQDFTDARLLVTSGEGQVDVSHEALIRGWPRLRSWLDDDRLALHIHHRLTEAAQLWQEMGYDEGILYRGTILEQAKEWHVYYDEYLNHVERGFLNASVNLQTQEEEERDAQRKREFEQLQKIADVERQRSEEQRNRVEEHIRGSKRLRKLSCILAIVSLIMVVAAYLAKQQADIASQKALQVRNAQSKALSIVSRQKTGESDPTLGLLLALEALPAQAEKNRSVLPSVEAALIYAVLAIREKHVLLGHSEAVNKVRFSPDSSLLATASRDRTVRLWNVSAGTAAFALESHDGQVYAAEFSQDNKWLVTASSDATARLWDIQTGELIHKLEGHKGHVYQASFSPSSRRIITASSDSTSRVWNAVTGKLRATLQPHGDEVWSAAFSHHDGELAVTASKDGAVRLWNGYTGELEALFAGHTKHVLRATFSSGNQRLITASGDKTARLWNVCTGKTIAALQGHEGGVEQAVFSTSGELVATTSDDSTVRLWDGMTGEAIAILQGHQGQVYDAAFSPNDEWLATAADDGTARLWRVKNRRTVGILKGHTARVWSAHFSPDGQYLATASEDNTARIWKVKPNITNTMLQGHGGDVRRAFFTPDGSQLFTVSNDTTVRIWDMRAQTELHVLKNHSGLVWYAVLSEDGQYLAATGDDGTTSLWNAATGQLKGTLRGHQGQVYHAHFSPDGNRLVTGGQEGEARIWDVHSHKLIATLKGHGQAVTFAEYSGDGSRIVTTSMDNTARLWNSKPPFKLVKLLEGHNKPIINGAFSPDSQLLATVSWDGTARLWDGKSGEPLAVLEGHRDAVLSVEFSQDSRQAVTAASDNTARVWDTLTGQPLVVLSGHANEVYHASFSPDGRFILTASKDGTAQLWHVTSGFLAATLKGHKAAVVNAEFSPDGQHVATASSDHTAGVWKLPIRTDEDWIKYAREQMPRQLTDDERRFYLQE